MTERIPLFQTSTLTLQERREEANKILHMLDREGISVEQFTSKESEFIQSCWEMDREITPRMLFWLRDIYAKYCL